ncbi:hypothetical protein AHiyo8_58830 [Arthrobacter sp. Hiyo8]|uniref:hypothetical protein n=1 Tax=Arthrobacter sp. Hiyo1 TaxID=1588020 RepID=UPI0006839F57|nr:hypothetical protein [Arthrobacter sp. Hiyo1]BAS17580.1 hypothetical protein AHiyo8_58830 [Arthrobacter sp. Hiyo8]GAP57939.1 hypothetical protein AHiyo1_09010 [Arthrobacter sp. Hiyo1]
MTTPNTPLAAGEEFTFTNSAPDDKEWTAGIELLNKWTTPDRYLRHIIQYARSGKHYPTDMHVDLIEQIINQRLKASEKTMADIEYKSAINDLTTNGEYVHKDEVAKRERAARLDELKMIEPLQGCRYIGGAVVNQKQIDGSTSTTIDYKIIEQRVAALEQEQKAVDN